MVIRVAVDRMSGDAACPGAPALLFVISVAHFPRTGVFVRFLQLNSGVDYRGILSCLDGYMNIALEQVSTFSTVRALSELTLGPKEVEAIEKYHSIKLKIVRHRRRHWVDKSICLMSYRQKSTSTDN